MYHINFLFFNDISCLEMFTVAWASEPGAYIADGDWMWGNFWQLQTRERNQFLQIKGKRKDRCV